MRKGDGGKGVTERREVQREAFDGDSERDPGGEAAKGSPHVTKIALGVITPSKSAEERLKFTKASGALKMQVRGTHAVQVFWVYTNRPDEVIEEITAKWEARR